MKKRYPFYQQLDAMDCGASCLRMVAKYHRRYFSLEYLRELTYIGKEGISLLGITNAAEKIGLRTLAVKLPYSKLITDLPLPCIVHWKQRHFVVVYEAHEDYVLLGDPARSGIFRMPKTEFEEGFTHESTGGNSVGVILLLEPTPAFEDQEQEHTSKSRWKFINTYAYRYRWQVVQLVLGVLIGVGLQVLFPIFIKGIVDVGIGYSKPNFITVAILGQVVLLAFQLLLEYLRRWALLDLSVRLNLQLFTDFLFKLTRLPVSFFEGRLSSDIMQRMADHDRVRNLYSTVALFSLLSFFSLLAYMGLLWVWSWKVLGLFVAGLGIQAVLVWFFISRKKHLEYKRFDQAADSQNYLLEMVNGMQEIKLHNAETQRRWKWERLLARSYRTYLESMRQEQWEETLLNFVNDGKNILVTLVTAHAVVQGHMSLGVMVGIHYIMSQVNRPVQEFANLARTYRKTRVSIERINELQEKETEPAETLHKIATIPEFGDIEVKKVSFQYPGPHSPVVIRNMSVHIPKGKVTALVGSSGSGKTTLVKLLMNIYQPTSGEIRIGGLNLRNIPEQAWRTKFGAVLQDGHIFNDTFARNVGLGDEIVDIQKLLNAVKIANLQSFIESLPLAYDTKIGDEGMRLSQGQKQRVLIARAIYKNPEYIFLDEATAFLDAYNEVLILDSIRDHCPQATIVIVAHRLSTVIQADKIIVIDAGEEVEVGTHKELLKRQGAYYSLIKNQLELGD